MESLPARRDETSGLESCSITQRILTASRDECARFLDGPRVTSKQIAQYLVAMRPIYWTAETTGAEDRAVLVAWTESLRDLAGELVVEAFREWFRTMRRRPTPADIREEVLHLHTKVRHRIWRLDYQAADVDETRTPVLSPDIAAKVREAVLGVAKAKTDKPGGGV